MCNVHGRDFDFFRDSVIYNQPINQLAKNSILEPKEIKIQSAYVAYSMFNLRNLGRNVRTLRQMTILSQLQNCNYLYDKTPGAFIAYACINDEPFL